MPPLRMDKSTKLRIPVFLCKFIFFSVLMVILWFAVFYFCLLNLVCYPDDWQTFDPRMQLCLFYKWMCNFCFLKEYVGKFSNKEYLVIKNLYIRHIHQHIVLLNGRIPFVACSVVFACNVKLSWSRTKKIISNGWEFRNKNRVVTVGSMVRGLWSYDRRSHRPLS